MAKNIFEGAATALITPFKDGKLDLDALGRLIETQISAKISALVVCGTTGESPTLFDDEKFTLFEFAAKTANGRVPVIAGTGSNCTDHAVKLSKLAEKAGCDALLAVTPYYNKGTPDGLFSHYEKIAKSTSLPLVAYNVPSRTGVTIPLPVLKKLTEKGLICALKEASGDMNRAVEIAAEIPDLTLYSGNDDRILPFYSIGGRGVVSVLSNIFPKETQKMCKLYSDGKTDEATALQLKFLPFINLLFAEVNPSPVKYAAHRIGLCECEYRLPLTRPSGDLCRRIDEELEKLK